MELRNLAAFREAARQASFSRAAARLGYAQSTVSAQIASLEADLGVVLFDRLTRAIALTDAGRALLPHAERLLDAADAARAAVTEAATPDGAVTGAVTVSAPETVLTYRLPTVLRELRARHPGIAVHLRPTAIGRLRGETLRALAAGSTDLAFVLDGPLDVPGTRAEWLTGEPISVIAPAGHALAAAASAGPADLAREPLLLPEAPDRGCAYRGEFERQLAAAGVPTTTALEFASIEAVKQCVLAGMGVSVLPTVAVEAELAAGRLVALPWTGAFDVATQVVWNARRSLTPAVRAVIDVARAALAAPAR